MILAKFSYFWYAIGMTLDQLRHTFQYQHLTARMLGIVLLLYQSEGKLKLKEISRELKLARPVISRSFDTLTALKMMIRVRGAEDGRDCFGILTDEGRAFVERISR
jgi:DNA-binding MarR family transcriptional regulator